MSQAVMDKPGVRRALSWYRVAAYVTGTFLLAVFIDYGIKLSPIDTSPTFNEVAKTLAVIHGWIFVVYVALCTDLWRRLDWKLPRLARMISGGIVPLLSFYTERRVTADVTARLAE